MSVSRPGCLTARGPDGGASLFGIGASSHFNGYLGANPAPVSPPFLGTSKAGGLMARGTGGGSPRLAVTGAGQSRSGGLMASGRRGGSSKASYTTIAPVIHNLVPANGANVYKNTFIEFDITDGFPVVLTEIQVDQGPVREVVYDGSAFVSPYQGSQQTTITGGYHYVIIRYGGWITSPVFRVIALDINLNQGTLGP